MNIFQHYRNELEPERQQVLTEAVQKLHAATSGSEDLLAGDTAKLAGNFLGTLYRMGFLGDDDCVETLIRENDGISLRLVKPADTEWSFAFISCDGWFAAI